MIIIDMEKLDNLRENIFVEIGKMLALAQLKANLGRAMRKVEGDATLQSTMESLKYHADQLQDQLKKHCQRWPDSKYCKEKNKSK